MRTDIRISVHLFLVAMLTPIALIAALLASMTDGQAQSTDDGAGIRSVDVPGRSIDPPGKQRQQGVTLNVAAFERGANVVQIELFDGERYQARRSAATTANGVTIWTGTIVGATSGDIVVVTSGGSASATITLDDAWYTIDSTDGDDVHTMVEIDPVAAAEELHDHDHDEVFDHGVDPADFAAPGGKGKGNGGGKTNPTPTPVPTSVPPPPDYGFDTTVDVMFVYTTDARSAGGGTNSMLQKFELMTTNINQILARSAVQFRVANVGSIEVDYNEVSNGYVDLTALRDPADGNMDEVHAYRDSVGADLIFFVPESASSCGLALPYSADNSLDYAYAQVRLDCTSNLIVPAHELAHLFGARHDWYTDDTVSDRYPAYGRGHVSLPGGWVTVMSYGGKCSANGVSCRASLHFSNPSLDFEGRPLGVPAGTNASCVERDASAPECDADTVRLLNERRADIAARRANVITPPPPQPTPTPTPTVVGPEPTPEPTTRPNPGKGRGRG